MYSLIRPLLFALPPETAHAFTLGALRSLHRLGLLPKTAHRTAPISLMGLQFANRVGLAAGLDKNGAYIDALGALGCGFIEVGTVTPHPQSGNSKPRLFRLLADRALINRMGFPNEGVHALCERLRLKQYAGICGVNIGKNAATPLTDAARDYVDCLRAVFPYADYVAVNLSSPNTTDLRRLQHGDQLRQLLDTLITTRSFLERESGRRVPILIKLTADLDAKDSLDAVRAAVTCGIDGVIATNTTVTRTGLKSVGDIPEGGLSGAPLLPRAVQALKCIRAEVGSSYPLIGVGGIQSAADAIALRNAGADLVQVYTGLVYRGPRLMREIIESSANA
jgi:dihydroorotate dehydrogenase